MPRPHAVVFLAYERFQILDLTGPAAVFASANYILKRKAYNVSVLSPNGGLVASDSGVSFATLALTRMPTSRPELPKAGVAMPDAICRCYPLGRRIDVPVACSTQQRDHWSA